MDILKIVMLLSTFIYSYLILYCKRSSFIFGIIASLLTGITLIVQDVYVQAILHFIYVAMYAYSFFSWGSKKYSGISNIKSKSLIVSVISISVFTLIIGYTFNKVRTVYPYIDAFSAACSMTAVILLNKKIIEHSYIFIISNLASMFICYMNKDYITILTFIIYMIFNITRVYTWEKLRDNEKIK